MKLYDLVGSSKHTKRLGEELAEPPAEIRKSGSKNEIDDKVKTSRLNTR